MAAIMTALFAYARPDSTIVYTTPLYGGTTGLIHRFLKPLGVTGIPVPPGDSAALEAGHPRRRRICCIVFLETPANPTMIMIDIERAAAAAAQHPDKPRGHGGQHVSGARRSSIRCCWARDLCLYSATKYLSGYSDMLGGVAITDAIRR